MFLLLDAGLRVSIVLVDIAIVVDLGQRRAGRDKMR